MASGGGSTAGGGGRGVVLDGVALGVAPAPTVQVATTIAAVKARWRVERNWGGGRTREI